jgi:hypothetical protein
MVHKSQMSIAKSKGTLLVNPLNGLISGGGNCGLFPSFSLSFQWCGAYQVPVYELVTLQEGHAFTDIVAHF